MFRTAENTSSTLRIPKVKDEVTEEEIKNCGKAIVGIKTYFKLKMENFQALELLE